MFNACGIVVKYGWSILPVTVHSLLGGERQQHARLPTFAWPGHHTLDRQWTGHGWQEKEILLLSQIHFV